MVANVTNHNNINNFYGSHQILEHTLKKTEIDEILFPTWDWYKNVVGLNQLL